MIVFRETPADLFDFDRRVAAIAPAPEMRHAAIAVRDAVSATLAADPDLLARVEARHVQGGVLRYRFADDGDVVVTVEGPGPDDERIAITTMPARALVSEMAA